MLFDEHQRFMATRRSAWMEMVYAVVSYLLEGTAFTFWIVALFFIYLRRILLFPKTFFTQSTTPSSGSHMH
jgi:hypothetical protein